MIVGGGDGGVAREVAKHSGVESIVQIEIDEKVIEVSKKFLPFMGQGLTHPKVTLHIGDGFEFMKKHKNEFDVIITDSSDPVGELHFNIKKLFRVHMKKKLQISTEISEKYHVIRR